MVLSPSSRRHAVAGLDVSVPGVPTHYHFITSIGTFG